jgi:hypothetical protein
MPGTPGRLFTTLGGGEARGRAETIVTVFDAGSGLAFFYGRRTPARNFPPPHPGKGVSGNFR